MNRPLKEATVQRHHSDTHAQMEAHLGALLNAYNFAKRLNTLGGLTPYEHVCAVWTSDPDRCKRDPTHLTAGLNTERSAFR